MKNHTKIFWFMTFHTKFCLVQNHCLLDLMKCMDLKISRSKTNDSKYEPIFGKIRYFISKKSVITYIISHNYAKVKINSNDSLTFRKNIDNCIMLLYLLSQLLMMMKIRCFF